jgi:hypothetical protein
MADPTHDDLIRRVTELEEHMHRLLLVIGAAGAMLAEVRHDDEENR